MITADSTKILKFLFEEELLSEIQKVSQLQKVPKGEIMIDVGEQVKFIPILLEGAIKIVREDESGEEVLLYYVEFGNTCAMTLNCCLENSTSEIRAICEKDTSIIMVPVSFMDKWLVNYRSWRNFIFQNYQDRLNEMLKAIDSLTFLKLDERLRNYLKEKSKVADDSTLEVTHLDIATDLNSSRVVISRLLKQMENEGEVSLGRNTIKIKY